MSAPRILTIATRQSRLALWQAEHVRAALQKLYPSCDVRLLGMTTKGDVILDRALSKVGGKGLFVKELEHALLDGRADLAVHSLKDVPMQLEPQFKLSAIMEREDPRDALVCPQNAHYQTWAQLPQPAVLGTSSLRREMMLNALLGNTAASNQTIVPLRGNLDTRLTKLDQGQYSAIVLAAAGLKRLGLAHRMSEILPVTLSLPAAGQGALAIECLTERADIQAALAPLNHEPTAQCVLAERAVSRALGGSCTIPLAAFAQRLDDGRLHLQTQLGLPDASVIIRSEHVGFDGQQLAQQAVEHLYQQGAESILETLKNWASSDQIDSKPLPVNGFNS